MKVALRSDLINDARKLSMAYQAVFDSKLPHVQLVIADLVRFCRARKPTVVPGSRQMSDVLSGRREVWLRIEQFTMDDPEKIVDENSRPMEDSLNSVNPKV